MTDTPPDVRPDVRSFLDYLNALPGPARHEMPPAEAREAFRATRTVTDLPVGELAVVRDLAIPGPAGTIPARLFDARATRVPGPALVYFHGGGFVVGDLDTHAGICAEIARVLDVPVVAVDYRLAPEHRWPAAPDDAEAAARWVAGSPATLDRSVASLILCGDSAGGALAIVTAMALRDEPAAVPVIVQAPIYPVVDGGMDYPSYETFAEGYLLTREAMEYYNAAYGADPESPRASPLHGRLEGLPPAVIVTAGLDPLRDQGRAYAAALVQAGVPTVFREAAGLIHAFVVFRKAIPSAQSDVAGYLAALKDVIAEAEGTRVMTQAAGR
jgi:acetyl esterase